jgi:hypothetical protein
MAGLPAALFRFCAGAIFMQGAAERSPRGEWCVGGKAEKMI